MATLLEQGWTELRRAREAREPFDLAEALIRLALRQAEDDDSPLAPAQHALANALVWKGEYAKANTILDIALRDPAPDRLRVEMTNLWIASLSAAGRSERACEVAREIVPLVFAVGDDSHTGQFYRNFGDALSRKGETDPAIERYTGAVIHFENAGDLRRRHDVGNNLSCLLIEKGRFEEAHEHLWAAISYFRSVGNRTALGQVYETQACAYEAVGKLEEAWVAARQSLALLEGGEEAELIRASRVTFGRVLEKLGVEKVAALVAAGGEDALAVGAAEDDAFAPVARANRPEAAGHRDAFEIGPHDALAAFAREHGAGE